MTIEELAQKNANAVAGYELVKYFEAASPIYKIELRFTMQKKKPLSVLQEFILKFLKENVTSTETICAFLGVNQDIVFNAIAELRANDLLTIDIYKANVKLTDKGRKVLDKASVIVPEELTFSIMMDGMTGDLFIDTKRYYKGNELKDNTMLPLRAALERPTVDDITYEKLNNAIKQYRVLNGKNSFFEGDLLSINRVEKVYTEYKKIYVLVYYNYEKDTMELRAFEKSTRCQEYETIILRMQNENLHQINLDKKTIVDELSERPLLNSLPKEIIEEAEEFENKKDEYQKQIDVLKTQIIDYSEQIDSEAVPEKEKVTATQQVRILRKQLEELENRQISANRILNTYDHRPLMIKALKEANKQVVIVSPWIKRSGVNNEVILLIEKALQRKVKVIIGYGISEEQDSDPKIVKRLEDMHKKKHGKYLDIVSLNNTHEKVLICDDDFLVITSFNWLSFRGDPKFGFRQETGYYTEIKEGIKGMKNNLSQRMGITLL